GQSARIAIAAIVTITATVIVIFTITATVIVIFTITATVTATAFIPIPMPFGVSPFTAAPAGKLGAIDGAAFGILEHASFAAGTPGVNAQRLEHSVIGIDAE